MSCHAYGACKPHKKIIKASAGRLKLMKKHRVEGTAKRRSGRMRRAIRTQYVVDCLHLPGDVVAGMELVTLTGNCGMEIRNFKRLISCTDDEICLLAGGHRMKICGSCLTIEYFAAEEVKIKGFITSIHYDS